MWVSSNNATPGDGYTNDPAWWFIKSGITKAVNVNVGNYLLSETLKEKLECDKTFSPTMQHAMNVASKYGNRIRYEPIIQDQYIYFPTNPGTTQAPGTLRVKFSYCNVGPTSIISQSSNNSFAPFRIDIKENGKQDPS